MDLIDKYLGEGKMGKLPGKIKRTIWGSDPETLTWELINPNNGDAGTNLKSIENIAYKELTDMKRKGILDFYESDFNVSKISSMSGESDYQAEVKLIKYDPNKLKSALRKLKFQTAR